MTTQTDRCEQCENGELCDRGARECPEQRRAAIDAGIPESVIDGKTRLRDHFSPEFIRAMSGIVEDSAA